MEIYVLLHKVYSFVIMLGVVFVSRKVAHLQMKILTHLENIVKQ